MKFMHLFYHKVRVFVFRIKLKNNRFIHDFFIFCKKNHISDDKIYGIVKIYKTEQINKVNDYLYLKLSSQDQNTFIRFFMKRFLNIETATEEEIKIIDAAFSKVKKLYSEQCESDGSVEFDFRDKKLRFYGFPKTKKGKNEAESCLLNYFDVTHAFYLTEYEMEGFNPENGEIILDCGAAHGDTALLFSALYPDSTVYSFEFEDSQFSILKKNLKVNHIEKNVPVQAFLYSDSARHFLDKEYKIAATEYSDGQKNIEIETLSIDDYVEMQGIGKIGLIKFDIEGGEQAALQGVIKTIERDKPLLYIPIYHLNDDIYKIPEFIYRLKMNYDFSIKWTDKKVWGVDCVLFVRFR